MYFTGVWGERNWLNAPGPFYGAFTDTCCCGLVAAPHNILYDANAMEFVWRQPTTLDEVIAVLDAAYQDPFVAYNWDGNDHWTPDLVMTWWDDRERRTGASIYKLRPPFRFARRPVCDRPTAELALLKCRASDEWLSIGA